MGWICLGVTHFGVRSIGSIGFGAYSIGFGADSFGFGADLICFEKDSICFGADSNYFGEDSIRFQNADSIGVGSIGIGLT